jgi:anamorsin
MVQALKNGGILRSQDGTFGSSDGSEKNEAILAGLSPQPGTGLVKVDLGAQVSVPLKLGRKKAAQTAPTAENGNKDADALTSVPLNGKRKSVDVSVPAGVGFDDGMNDSDDELIDEDTLLDEDDLKRPINIREYRDSTRQAL